MDSKETLNAMSWNKEEFDQHTSCDEEAPDAENLSKSRFQKIIEEKESEIRIITKRAENTEHLLKEAHTFIAALEAKVTSLSSQIDEYHSLKENGVSVSLQVSGTDIEGAYGEKPMPSWGQHGGGDDAALSISESLKAAAEEVVQGQEGGSVYDNSCDQQAQAGSDYVYDEQTGFYYHPASGYYWDPTSSLFYDYTSGTYYQYDEATGEYVVHSQVDVAAQMDTEYYRDWPSALTGVDSLSSQLSHLSISTQRYQKNALELAENYPPCIRIIVQESEHLQLGSLAIITCAGGTIGREPNMGHAMEIRDLNISKLHAQVEYNYDCSCYCITDKGSQNGTFLNNQRLSKSKQESLGHPLKHNDILEVGGTRLLLHIHSGHETCQGCEPGQIQAKLKAQNPVKNDYIVLSKDEKNRQRLKELKQIKKKYKLQNSHFESPGANAPDSDYCDKAYLRRKYVGSEPPESAAQSKELPASVQSPISASNKGHKLLAKMGWKEGEGLGKNNAGIAEPINVELRVNQNAGLGSAEGVSLSLDNVHRSNKAKRWAQARQMYNRLEAQGNQATSSTSENTGRSTSSSTVQGAAYIASSMTDQMLPSSESLYPGKSSPDSDSPQNPAAFNISDSSVAGSQVRPKKYASTPKISWVKGATQKPP